MAKAGKREKEACNVGFPSQNVACSLGKQTCLKGYSLYTPSPAGAKMSLAQEPILIVPSAGKKATCDFI